MDRNKLDLDCYPEVPEAIVKLEGELHHIRPFAGPKIPRAVRLSRPLFEYFAAFRETGEQRIDWGYLVEHHWDTTTALCALELGWETERVEALMPDQQVDLVRAVLRVNLDFFYQRFPPSLGRLAQDVATQLESVSGKRGSASSAPAIPRLPSWLTPWRKSSGGSRR